MNTAKDGNAQNERETRSADQQGHDPAGLNRNSWVYPAGATQNQRTPQKTPQSHPPAPRRRLYADYRELLALEGSAKRLNFLGTEGARSAPTEQQAHASERAPAGAEGLTGSVPGPATVDPGSAGPTILDSIDRPVLLAVDQRMSMFFGSRKNFKSVVAAEVAGLIAWQVLGREKTLSAVIFNDRKIVQFGPGRSRLHTVLILQAILSQNHTLPSSDGIYSNPGMLNDALRRASKRAENDAIIFFITDASGANEETFRLATSMSEQNNLFIILIYDAEQAEFCRPSSFFDDGSLSRLAIRRGARFLRERNQNPAERQRFLAGRLFPNGITIIPLNTRDNVIAQLRRAFSKSALAAIAKARHPQAGYSSAVAPHEGQL